MLTVALVDTEHWILRSNTSITRITSNINRVIRIKGEAMKSVPVLIIGK